MPNQCTQAEWKILEVLWEQGGLSAGQITRALQLQNGWTQHTVCMLIKRMQQKQLIELDESGSVERYVCRLPQEKVSIAQPPVCMTLLQRLRARFVKGGTHK